MLIEHFGARDLDNTPIIEDVDVGRNVVAVVRSIDPKAFDALPTSHVLKRSTGRTLEEMVELCLACGLSAKNIMAHVVDALHNEARKAHKFPSMLMLPPDKGEALIELADVELCLEAVRHLAGIERTPVEQEILRKTGQLERQVKAGEMVLVDGLMYRRVRHP